MQEVERFEASSGECKVSNTKFEMQTLDCKLPSWNIEVLTFSGVYYFEINLQKFSIEINNFLSQISPDTASASLSVA